MIPEVVLNFNSILGEGPLWDGEAQQLWWLDIKAGLVHRYSPATGENVSFDVGQPVGSLALREGGGLLVALKSGFHNFDPLTGVLEPIADPESDIPNNRFNEGKADPSGSFYAGTMSEPIVDGAGSFYHLSTGGDVTKIMGDVSVSNGIAWNSAETIMYYIDTWTLKVQAFDFDKTTGAVSNRRAQFSFPEGIGHPDGMTIDTEDMLWVAFYGGGAVRRYDPATGKMLAEIKLPASQTTSCEFGGANLDTLYITSAADGIDLTKEPLAGALFAVKTGFKGRPTYRFKG